MSSQRTVHSIDFNDVSDLELQSFEVPVAFKISRTCTHLYTHYITTVLSSHVCCVVLCCCPIIYLCVYVYVHVYVYGSPDTRHRRVVRLGVHRQPGVRHPVHRSRERRHSLVPMPPAAEGATGCQQGAERQRGDQVHSQPILQL